MLKQRVLRLVMDYRGFLHTHPFSPEDYEYAATLGWLQYIHPSIHCRDRIVEIIQTNLGPNGKLTPPRRNVNGKKNTRLTTS